jgi:hypothetical protein
VLDVVAVALEACHLVTARRECLSFLIDDPVLPAGRV